MAVIQGMNPFNTRFQLRVNRNSGIYRIKELSLFLLKDYGNPPGKCRSSASDRENCLIDKSTDTIRKTLIEFDDKNDLLHKYYGAPDKKIFASYMQSQDDAPFASTMNVTYSGTTETSLEYASVAENIVDSVAIYNCVINPNCKDLYFGEYWRDYYIDQLGKSYTDRKDWRGNELDFYFNGVHNSLSTSPTYMSSFHYSYSNGEGIQNSLTNKNTPQITIPGYDTVHSHEGLGKDLSLIMYTDRLCHNAWTINVTGADSSWCRENLLVGRTCVPECPAGTKSNRAITCTDPKTFSVTVPEGIECVPDTCPDSPIPGSIPNGKVNDCIGLLANETCNPLCNEGMKAFGQISCPNGITNKTFRCEPPCGMSVPEQFDHGGDINGEASPRKNLFGNNIPQPILALNNMNPCLFIKPGETCKPTCNSGYILEGEMTCSAEKVFSNTAVCRSVCHIDRLVPNATNNDCQTKLLNPGEYCIVRTKGGYSFPDNTKMANITCDANGDIIYPPDPKKDCDWDPVPFGDVGHCLPNVKDTILNVQGACKPGQIVKDAETCVHMYKMIDKHDLKSNWSFALGDNKQLEDKGNYILDTEADDPFQGNRFYADTSPLGCGLGAKGVSYSKSHGYYGRVYRDVTKIGTAGEKPFTGWYSQQIMV